MSARRSRGIREWGTALEWHDFRERRVYMNSIAESPRRLIVGISGASGIVYGIEALKMLRELGLQTHLVVSKSAIVTLSHETDMKYAELCALCDVHYQSTDIGAAIASGSFRTLGMLVAPCSIRSLSEIAS